MNYTGAISDEDRQYVEDVLALYTGLKKYEDKHPDEQLAASHLLQFRGFDAGRPLEYEYLQYARFLISKKRKFQKISKGRRGGYVFDTHLPTTSIYLPMVKKWRQFGRKQVLSKDEVLDILGIVKKDPSELN